jgi:predicted DNA binding protein
MSNESATSLNVELTRNAELVTFANPQTPELINNFSMKNSGSFIRSETSYCESNKSLHSASFLSSTTKDFHRRLDFDDDDDDDDNDKNYKKEEFGLYEAVRTTAKTWNVSQSQRSFCSQYGSLSSDSACSQHFPMVSSIISDLADLDEKYSRIQQILLKSSTTSDLKTARNNEISESDLLIVRGGEFFHRVAAPSPTCASTPTKQPASTSTPQSSRSSWRMRSSSSHHDYTPALHCCPSTRLDDSCMNSCCSLDCPFVEGTQLYSPNEYSSDAWSCGGETTSDSDLSWNRLDECEQLPKLVVEKQAKSGGSSKLNAVVVVSTFRSLVVKRCLKPFKRLCNMKIFDF